MSRKLKSAFALLASTALIAAGTSSAGAEDLNDPEVAPRANFWESPTTTGMFYNNPTNDDDDARDLIDDRINGAPAGSVIRIQSWSFTDPGIAQELNEAENRGVHIRYLTGKANCSETQQMLDDYHINLDKAGSWFRCVRTSADRPHGMHQKTLLFSRSSGVDEITLVGSSNLASANWSQQWNDIYQFGGRHDVYTWYLNRFTAIANNFDDPWSVPYTTEGAGTLDTLFLPIRVEAPTRSQDPVWARLHALPANPDGHTTQLRIAMYAMDNEKRPGMEASRGEWLVDKLISLKQRGANIRFIAGSEVKQDIKDRLRGAGIPVLDGYRTDEFVHLKMMTVRFWNGEAWVHRSYTGSANWSLEGLVRNFEVDQRITGVNTWNAYNELFNEIWSFYN